MDDVQNDSEKNLKSTIREVMVKALGLITEFLA
jgi:hypothetical protein